MIAIIAHIINFSVTIPNCFTQKGEFPLRDELSNSVTSRIDRVEGFL